MVRARYKTVHKGSQNPHEQTKMDAVLFFPLVWLNVLILGWAKQTLFFL